jgi:curved DNA-binding protein CbpA
MFMVDLGAQSYYSILGLSPQADAKQVRENTQRVYRELEKQRDKARDEDEKRAITEKQANINRIGGKLANPTERAKYDLENVHLTFFTIRPAGALVWSERDPLLRWMHRAVREFLVAKGESIEPMTDLERCDFTADFTANRLLEELLRREQRGAA